jgi:hypothetical protein
MTTHKSRKHGKEIKETIEGTNTSRSGGDVSGSIYANMGLTMGLPWANIKSPWANIKSPRANHGLTMG